MASSSNSADIGIRVFLEDAASQGLFAIDSNLGRLGQTAKTSGMLFGDMSMKLAGLAVVAGLALSFVGFAGAIVYSTIAAASFATTLIKIQRATQATQPEMDLLATKIQDMAGNSIFSIQQLGDGFILLGQRGFTLTDIMDGVGQAGINLAEAIGTTPVEAMGLLGIVMSSMGLKAKDAAHTADLLQYAFEHGIPSVTAMTQAITAVGGEARLLGVPLNDLVVLLGTLTVSLGSGSKAGTALRQMMQALAAPSAAATTELNTLGITLYDSNGHAKDFTGVIEQLATKLSGLDDKARSAALKDIFTIRAGQGAGQIVPQIDQIMAALDKLKTTQGNSGVAQHKANDIMASAQGLWSSLVTNIQSVAINIGGPFLAAFKPALQALQHMSATLLDVSQKNPQTLATFLALGAAISGVGLIIVAIVASPLGLFIGIMVAVMSAVAGVAAIILNWKSIWASLEPILQKVWSVLQTIGAVLLTVGAAIIGIKVASLVDNFFSLAIAVGRATLAFLAQLPALFASGASYVMMLIRMVALQFVIIGGLPGLLALAGAWLFNAAAMALALLPYILLGALIAGAVIGIVLLLRQMGGLHAILGILQAAWNALLPALQQAGAAIKGALMDAIKQLQPVWQQLVAAFHQAEPVLKALGMILGVIILVALGMVIGVLRGFINVLVVVITTVIKVVSGIIQIFAGLVQFFMGFFTMIHGLFVGVATGNWTMFQQGIATMRDGVINIFKGLWNAVSAVFIGAFNAIKGYITGFIDGIVNFFKGLANTLVHHSIFPDMLQAMVGSVLSIGPNIVSGFGNVVHGIITFAESLPGKVTSALGNLGSTLFNSGVAMVQGFINGLMSMIGNIKNAAANILSGVRNLFPHSPAKEGPLMDAHTWMPNLVHILSDTAEGAGPSLKASMGRVAGSARAGLGSPSGAGGGGTSGGATYTFVLDGKPIMSFFHNQVTGQLQANGAGRLLR